jgi:hypothetical protein
MAQTNVPGVRTAKSLIERDWVEGTTVYDPDDNEIGTIKRLVIEKISGRVASAAMSLAGSWAWARRSAPFRGTSSPMIPGLGYRTDVTKDQLWDAPTFSRDRDYDWLGRQREQERHYRYSARYYGGDLSERRKG